jgi:hypothetical protein
VSAATVSTATVSTATVSTSVESAATSVAAVLPPQDAKETATIAANANTNFFIIFYFKMLNNKFAF